MSTLTANPRLTPEDVERASDQDDKRYELIDGELREKVVGFAALVIAVRIAERLNALYYQHEGAAAVEAMIYCFGRPNHGRKPDVTYVKKSRWPGGEIPEGDLHFAPDLVVEVLSPSNTGIELDEKLAEYLSAGVPLVWIVNPNAKTIRVYRGDGTMRLYRTADTIENDPLLPGFTLAVGGVFPKLSTA